MLSWITSSHADFASSWIELIGPLGTNLRMVLGRYPPCGYDGKQGIPPSGLMHRREGGQRIGGWRDYRTIWRNPDTDFVYRAFEAGLRFVSTGELTVYKFASAHRKNSYIEKPWHEQATYHRRIGQSRWFVLKESLKIAAVHYRRAPMMVPSMPAPPEPHTPGWEVSQFRKYRGL